MAVGVYEDLDVGPNGVTKRRYDLGAVPFAFAGDVAAHVRRVIAPNLMGERIGFQGRVALLDQRNAALSDLLRGAVLGMRIQQDAVPDRPAQQFVDGLPQGLSF